MAQYPVITLERHAARFWSIHRWLSALWASHPTPTDLIEVTRMHDPDHPDDQLWLLRAPRKATGEPW